MLNVGHTSLLLIFLDTFSLNVNNFFLNDHLLLYFRLGHDFDLFFDDNPLRLMDFINANVFVNDWSWEHFLEVSV